jgi:hypothetical protein
MTGPEDVLNAVVDQLLRERRPARYTVDENGHAPWMDGVIAEVVQVMGTMPPEALESMLFADTVGGEFE